MTDVIDELILQTRQSGDITSIVVTHEMSTVKKVADRVVMLYPISRLGPGEGQVIFEGPAEEAFHHHDRRVSPICSGRSRRSAEGTSTFELRHQSLFRFGMGMSESRPLQFRVGMFVIVALMSAIGLVLHIRRNALDVGRILHSGGPF